MQLLLREDAAGRRKFRDGHALDVEARVEAGDCVTDLTLLEDDGTALVLGAGENHSRFREGDPAWLGDGARPGAGLPVNVIDYDPVAGLLRVERDVFARNEPFDLEGPCVLDRREISTIDKLARALQRSLSGRAPAGDLPTRLLAGDSLPPIAPGGLAGSRAEARADGLDPSQEIAYAEALAAGPLYLVQGPPGSGKTRLLGSLLRAFAARGERVLVTAFTHLAINNVLRACLAGGDAPCPVFKIGRPAQNPDLQALPITIRPRLRRDAAAEGPLIVGATVYGAIGLWDALPFDRVVIDEAAQVPLPMGMAALGSAPRTTLVGDHQQMGPIVRTDPPDALAGVSIFAHLHAIYGSTLLTRTYRMNAEINDFVSRHFYAGRLASDPSCAGRRLALRPGGRFRDLLDPERPAVVALVDHEGCRQRAPAEAALAAELVIELMAHHRVPAREIAVIAPYRAQVNAIRQALRARVTKRPVKSGGNLEAEPVIDTVERIQGQERDVVIASFTNSDPDYLIRDASFFYSPNRLNVLLSRARVKRIVIASPLAFRAIPRDLETLRHASLFRRLHDESDRMVVPGGDA
ncbi:MAG: ATP-binding protein [Deltaproteobacteria bacterium]|nr:ATP-binding protein [Deltaproteobacteria bacterium]